jgi:hypothetical protein
MKKRNRKTGRLFAAMVLATVLLSLLAMPAHAAGGPFTEGVKTLWEEHSGEIFSALALAGSVLVAVLYKVGLLPLLKKALGAIGTAAKGTAAKTEELVRTVEERERALSDLLSPVADQVTAMEKHVEQAQAASAAVLGRLEELEKREENARRLLRGQIAMLHGLAMGANLPKFRKDAIDREYLSLTAGDGGQEGGEQ